MIKLIACLRRRPGLSPEEFRRHWLQVHGPLIRSLPEMTRHIVRYVQMHPASASLDADATAGEPFDGVAEMVFADEAAMARAFAEPAYLSRVRPDEESFLDLARCHVLLVHEHPMIVDGRPVE